MIYDISMKISYDMPVYNNSDAKRPALRVGHDYSTGNFYESRIDMDLHSGTHLDAPLHMIEAGSKIEELELSRVITKCRVIDVTSVRDRITRSDLVNKGIKQGEFILLKTVNSFSNEFTKEFVFVDESGAEFLKDTGIAGVGSDALGIERDQPGHPTHKLLLGNGIVVLEGIRLAEVLEGEYILFAVPLKIIDAEASPVRAFLMDKEDLGKLL